MTGGRKMGCSVGHRVGGIPYVRWRTDPQGAWRNPDTRTHSDVGGGALLSRNVLLILSDAAEATAVRRSLVNSRDGPFKVEWVSRCGDAIERLRSQRGEVIAAVAVDLFLSDSQGIETLDRLLRVSPPVALLVLSRC